MKFSPLPRLNIRFRFLVAALGALLTQTVVQADPLPDSTTLNWTTLVDSGAAVPDATRALGMMSNGDVISASQIGASTGAQIRVQRNAGAVATWTRDVGTAGLAEDVADIVVNPATGDTYVAVRATTAANGLDWLVFKVNGADGTLGWASSYTYGTTGNDVPRAICFTSDGNIAVAGMETNVAAGQSRMRVTKLNAGTGAEVWNFTSTVNGTDALDVVGGSTGQVVAVGRSGTDAYAVFLSSAGANSATQTYAGSGGGDDVWNAVALLSTGDVVVAGQVSEAAGKNFAAVRYPSAGTAPTWSSTINGSANADDVAFDVAVDAADNVYVAGMLRDSVNGQVAQLVKLLGADGTVSWSNSKNGSSAVAEATDAFFSVRVVGAYILAAGTTADADNKSNLLVSRYGSAGVSLEDLFYDGAAHKSDLLLSKNLFAYQGYAVAIGGSTENADSVSDGIVSSYAVTPPPDIVVFNGASTNGADERTDNVGTQGFGSVFTGSSSVAQTFTIQNTGTLDLTGLVVTSTNATEFTFTAPLVTTLATNATTTFTVTFSPGAAGSRTGVINIASNDPDENPFRIQVSGTGVVPVPEIAVSGKTLDIVDGDATPRVEDDTDFGETPVGTPTSRTFTLVNTGTATLNVGAITVLPAGFTIVAPFASATVAPNGSTTVTVKCDALTEGVFTSTLSIVNNDADENPFNFSITCSVVDAPIAPIVTTLGDVVTGGGAPAEDGAAPIGDFGVLRRGGFIAENGYMVFPGTLEIGTGSPAVTVETSSGLWKTAGGNLFLLARSGTTVPDVAGAQFDVLPEVPGVNDSGEVGFLGTLIIGTGGVTVNNDTGLWSEIGGSGLKLLMREDDDVPGVAGAKVKQFVSGLFATAHTGATTGEAAYSVTYKGASTKTALLRASVSGATTTITEIAREGNAAPGTAVTFSNLAGTYTDPGRMDAQGNFVFSALTTPGSNDGIWYQAVGGSTVLAVFRGNVAPGTSGATFSKIYRPSMGSAGVFTFRAGVANNTGDNTGNLRNDGIWRGSVAGGFNCILRRGDGVSVVSNLPGVSKVGNVWGGWLSNSNLGAWKAWLDVNGNTVSSTADGDVNAIFADLSGAMQLAVKVGDAAAGTTGASFSGFDLPVVGGNNQYAFLGTLTGGDTTAANNEGLWRSASNGGVLSLVVRKGDVITTTEGDKTITKIDLPGSNSTDRRWEQPVMDGTGQMVIYITFGDGSTTQILAK